VLEVTNLLSARFVDFFTAVATTSYVCCALTPVIPEVSFLGHEWPKVAYSVEKLLKTWSKRFCWGS
jgi:hypothetical protein